MDALLKPEQAAKLLQVEPATLATWRWRRRYPLRFVKIGAKVFYKLADLEAFVAARTVSGTAKPRRRRSQKAKP